MTDPYWGSSSCEIGPAVAIPGISKLVAENKQYAQIIRDFASEQNKFLKNEIAHLERIAELEEAIRQALDARRINKHPMANITRKALAVQRILEKAIGELE